MTDKTMQYISSARTIRAKRFSAGSFTGPALILLLCSSLSVGAQTRPAAKKPAPTPTKTAIAKLTFTKDILPIFKTNCVACHGEKEPSSGLTLTSYARLMKGGKRGVQLVPGKSVESLLVKYIDGRLSPRMPIGGSLKAEEIERVRQWVDSGAKEGAEQPGSTINPLAKMPRIAAPVPVTALAFSPDGKMLAVGLYQEVQFWDVETRTRRNVWKGHADAVRSLAYSKDGKMLAAGGGTPGVSGEIRLWDTTQGRETLTFGDQADTIYAVAFRPDGKQIASGSADKTARVWDNTGKGLATLRDHSDAVTCLAYSPDGKFLVTGSNDKSLKVWDGQNSKRLYSFGAHDEAITDVEFSPDGKTLLSSSLDRSVRLWNFGPENSSFARAMNGHSHVVYAAVFASDGQSVASASADKSVRLWKPGDGNNYRTLTEAKDWLYAVRFSPDRKHVAAGCWDGFVLLWNAADGKLEARLEPFAK